MSSFPQTSGATDRRRVLVITGDPLGAKLAGPAIRAWNMSDALSDASEVVLLSTTAVAVASPRFRVEFLRPGDDKGFAAWERWADIIIFQGHAMETFEALATTQKIVIADIYDPMHLEQLEQGKNAPRPEWDDRITNAVAALNQQLSRADFFLCASQRQRYFYLGQLATLGRLNSQTYENDPDFARLISVVPFGLSAEFPAQDRGVLRGVRSGIGVDDKLLLWSGGLYDWFDPETLIRAVGELAQTRPSVRLFFQGTKHPNPDVPEMAIVAESRALALSLGLLDSSVFFNDSWVDFADRHNYLREADAGVSTHLQHIETTMSFRTRILDYLWAGLPIVVTEGDYFAELVASEGLGVVVAPRNPAALAAALERVLFDEDFAADARANVARVREQFMWAEVLRPLLQFVATASRSADAEAITRAGRPDSSRVLFPLRRAGLRFAVSRSWYYLRNGGPTALAARLRARSRRS